MYAFSYCSNLTEILVQEGNEYYCSENGVLYNIEKTTIIRYPEKKAGTSFEIPATVELIDSGAFAQCSSLTSISIPDSVSRISIQAFRGCSGVESFTIPSSVTNIDDRAFSYCTSMTSVVISNGNTVMGNDVFSGSWSLTIYGLSGSTAQAYAENNNIPFEVMGGEPPVMDDPDFILPASLTSIESEAFLGISASVVKLPDSVADIGSRAFADCPNLQQIYIPAVTTIADDAFSGVTGLIIFGAPGSPAEQFAQTHAGIEFCAAEQ